MPFTSDGEFLGQTLTGGLIAAGSAWYLSDVPVDAATSLWPNVVAGFALLCALLPWMLPETYTDRDRHALLYGLFGGIPLLAASYGLHGTAYATLSRIYLWVGGLCVVLGCAVFLLHVVRGGRAKAGG